MPIYEYRCNTCGEAFEKRLSWSEADHNPICPNCSSQDTKKKISMVSALGSANSKNSSSTGSSCSPSGRFG